MFSKLFKKRAGRDPVPAYAKINMRLMPEQRASLFEEPLHAALVQQGLGEVTGGGTQTAPNGEIASCGIDLALNPDRLNDAVTFACEVLNRNGAPCGSELIYATDGKKYAADFGVASGIAVYLSRTGLPAEVYQNNDTNQAIDALSRLLDPPQAGHALLMGHFQNETEIMLYYYGDSTQKMRAAIAGFLASNPLCQNARVVDIA